MAVPVVHRDIRPFEKSAHLCPKLIVKLQFRKRSNLKVICDAAELVS